MTDLQFVCAVILVGAGLWWLGMEGYDGYQRRCSRRATLKRMEGWYADPGQPCARVVPPTPPAEAVCHSTRYVASTDDLRAADPASEESGYATTILKLVRRERVH